MKTKFLLAAVAGAALLLSACGADPKHVASNAATALAAGDISAFFEEVRPDQRSFAFPQHQTAMLRNFEGCAVKAASKLSEAGPHDARITLLFAAPCGRNVLDQQNTKCSFDLEKIGSRYYLGPSPASVNCSAN